MQRFLYILNTFIPRMDWRIIFSNRNALYIDKGDNVFIGSSKGISVLNPWLFKKLRPPFHLGVTTLECIQQEGNGFCFHPRSNERWNLAFVLLRNSIRLQYSVLDFTQPKFNQYRHKFLPLMKIGYTENDSKLTYYNLPLGPMNWYSTAKTIKGIWKEPPLN